MANGSRFNPTWIAVIFTALVLASGIVGGWFVLGERQKVQAKELLKHEKIIKSNKDECDRMIEVIQQQTQAQTQLLIEVKNDVKWLKQNQEGN